jgi:hypothetical protein
MDCMTFNRIEACGFYHYEARFAGEILCVKGSSGRQSRFREP